MQPVAVALGILIAIGILIVLLFIIIRQFYAKRPQLSGRRQSDEVSLTPSAGRDDSSPGIGVMGRDTAIRSFMQKKGQAQGRSVSDWGYFNIMFNPSPWDKRVHAAIFFHDANPWDLLIWQLARKPATIEGTRPWWSKWLPSFTDAHIDPFDHLLRRIHDGNAVSRQSVV